MKERQPWRSGKGCFATATQDDLFFMQWRPAEAGSDGGLIEFALDHELRAAVIETEDLVIEIETVHDKAQATGHFDATLSVKLKMGIEEVVAERPVPGGAITDDIFSVVGKPHPPFTQWPLGPKE